MPAWVTLTSRHRPVPPGTTVASPHSPTSPPPTLGVWLPQHSRRQQGGGPALQHSPCVGTGYVPCR